jgi:hypothetical protein
MLTMGMLERYVLKRTMSSWSRPWPCWGRW